MDIVKIPLRNRAGDTIDYALVDFEDAAFVDQLRWHRTKIGNTHYAIRRERGKTVYLHRKLLDPPRDLHVDHLNRDGLDNRRENLRLTTPAGNRQNQRPRRNKQTSKYRGVYWCKDRERWVVRVKIDGKVHCLGRFRDEDEAGETARVFRVAHMPYALD